MNELERTILEMVKERYDRSGGNNGYSVAALRYDLDVPLESFNTALDNLEKAGKIVFRIGSSTKLVFWKAS